MNLLSKKPRWNQCRRCLFPYLNRSVAGVPSHFQTYVSELQVDYLPPSSGQQFATIYDLHASSSPNTAEWQRLLQFVGLGPYGVLVDEPQVQQRLQQTLVRSVAALAGRNKGSTTGDDDVYDALRECYWTQVVGTPEHARAAARAANTRTEARAVEVVALAEGVPASSVLDLGCADGQITARVGEILGLDAANVHGCDDLASMSAGGERSPGFTFTKLPASDDGAPRWDAAGRVPTRVLPYADESFDVVFSLMTLHHIRHRQEILEDVRRVLKPGGVFIFREHDCTSETMAGVLDVMHGLHFRSWANENQPNYRARGWLQSNYRGYYQSAEAWNRSVIAAGFVARERGLHPFSGNHSAVPIMNDAGTATEASVLHGAQLQSFLQTRQRGWTVDETTRHQHVRFVDVKGVFFGTYIAVNK